MVEFVCSFHFMLPDFNFNACLDYTDEAEIDPKNCLARVGVALENDEKRGNLRHAMKLLQRRREGGRRLTHMARIDFRFFTHNSNCQSEL